MVAALESYEPARGMTARALEHHARDGSVSVMTLHAELERLDASPIVLNRALREAVRAAVERGEMSLSEIAMRCGRVKHDARGNASRESTWLARRIGELPEPGEATNLALGPQRRAGPDRAREPWHSTRTGRAGLRSRVHA